jgi:Histidine kinase-, DNA gyrase B-, and HSP90-like ATPase
MNRKTEHSSRARGKLKIGDDWNAITIIALSQTSPLKAIAALVENSIDAKARTVTITRGREHRRHLLSIRDDGEGGRATTPAGRISATWRPTSVIPSSAGSRPRGPRAYRASSGSAC